MKRSRSIILGTVSGLLLLAAGIPYLLPVPLLAGAVPPEQLADPDSLFITVGGLKLHYKRYGSGLPVYLLLHGFGASTYSWREVTASLAQQGSVLVPDRPGYGLTQRIVPQGQGAENPYSVAGQSALLTRFLDALGVDQVILVGHSAGGTVAVQFALDYPGRVQALVLVDAAVYHLERRLGFLQAVIRSRWAYRLGLLTTRSLAKRAETLGRLAWYDFSQAPPDYIEQYVKPLRSNDWDVGLWEATRAMQPLNQVNRLSELQMPVLVVSGAEDRVVPLADAERLARVVANAELAVIPRCGHLPHEECPHEFLAVVTGFIENKGVVPAG
ncbi:MAG: alpha/beta fold hydrolase [Anaerolineae bacterium]